ncbi:MAG: tripartite tricarboxylate transporter TctB family protein [Deltaproteobacteria bacterium]|nr:tripartite tricarboxylate transporter TctB family protein [Deltaproteobacteria bacterium]
MNSWGFFSRLKGPLLIFLLSLYLYFLAGKMEEVPIPGQLGPAFWPKAILILLMISCGIKALEFFFAEKRKKAPEQELSRPPVNLPKLAVMIVLVIAAVVALDALGFLLANFLFLLSFMRVAGLKKKIPLLLTSVLGTILLIYLFVKVVYLPLPKGRWFFDDVTIFLYRILRVF